ncbi:alpha/beta fold hydrolase [Streptomyces sp. NPDC002076]
MTHDPHARHDLAELKNFVLLHARALGLDAEEAALVRDRIDRDDGSGRPGSWAGEWTAAAEAREHAGDLSGAVARYILASFPYPDSLARHRARTRGQEVFDRWRSALPGVGRLDVRTPAGTVRCYTAGLDADPARPVVVVTGGIVSVKEQWSPFLLLAEQAHLAVVVAEMPGVGENTMPYRRDSHQLYGAVLDALDGRADTSHAVLVALSFSGHLALRHAAQNPRIRGIVTVGAPVAAFFTDSAWWPRIPDLTLDTLARLTGVRRPGLREHLTEWALAADELRALDIPVTYVRSLRDEIIPGADAELLARHVPELELIEYDDVHGSPGHVDEVRAALAQAVLRMTGRQPTVARPTVGSLQGSGT